MADMDPVRAGDTISAADYNFALGTLRGATQLAGRATPGPAGPNLGGGPQEKQHVETARAVKLIKPKLRNVFDEGTMTDDDRANNAVLMIYDPQAKCWRDKPGGGITVFLLEDGIDLNGVGALPIPTDTQFRVWYSRTAQAWIPMSQPRSAVVHVSSAEADINSIQDAESAVWDSDNQLWVVTGSIKVIRIGT